jgi:hypothetical protein
VGLQASRSAVISSQHEILSCGQTASKGSLTRQSNTVSLIQLPSTKLELLRVPKSPRQLGSERSGAILGEASFSFSQHIVCGLAAKRHVPWPHSHVHPRETARSMCTSMRSPRIRAPLPNCRRLSSRLAQNEHAVAANFQTSANTGTSFMRLCAGQPLNNISYSNHKFWAWAHLITLRTRRYVP